MNKRKFLPIFGGLLFMCGALLCGLLGLYSSIRAANRVEGLTPVTVAVLEDSLPGSKVLVEGHVSSRNPVRSPFTGFVAYVREEREIYYDDEGNPDPGSWSVSGRVTPPLLLALSPALSSVEAIAEGLELSDGLVQIENSDYDLEDASTVEEESIGEDSDTRYKGIEIGDPVIAVGVVSAGGERPQIKADFIARGTQASYIARRRSGGVIFCVGSVVIAAVGGLILMWDRVARLLPWRR